MSKSKMSYCNRRVRLLESFSTLYRSRGRSRGLDSPKSAKLLETAVLQAELCPRGLLLDRNALCEVGTSRVRARSRDLGSPFHPCNFNRN